MNIPGPLMYAGKDADGFSVFLFCGPMPRTGFSIPTPRPQEGATR